MFNCYLKIKDKNKELEKISNKLSSNYVICKEILELLDNNSTKIKLDEDIKNSYYVFFNDTIYLSDREKNKTCYQRVCFIAHECIHSIQNKTIQVINFVLSNVELIAFIIALICMLFKTNTNLIFYIYLLINVISAIPRLILEIDAVIKSIYLSAKYIKNNIDEKEANILIKAYKLKILIFSPIFIISLLIGRILRIILISMFMM